MKGVLMTLLAGLAIALSVVTGAVGDAIEAVHPSKPKIEIIPGSFGGAEKARSLYQKEADTKIIVPSAAQSVTGGAP